MTESRGSRGLTVKVDVDVSEALTGLKALQREAKKATQALKELDEAKRGYDAQEGSVIYYLAKHFGISASELLAKSPNEIALMLASVESGAVE